MHASVDWGNGEHVLIDVVFAGRENLVPDTDTADWHERARQSVSRPTFNRDSVAYLGVSCGHVWTEVHCGDCVGLDNTHEPLCDVPRLTVVGYLPEIGVDTPRARRQNGGLRTLETDDAIRKCQEGLGVEVGQHLGIDERPEPLDDELQFVLGEIFEQVRHVGDMKRLKHLLNGIDPLFFEHLPDGFDQLRSEGLVLLDDRFRV